MNFHVLVAGNKAIPGMCAAGEIAGGTQAMLGAPSGKCWDEPSGETGSGIKFNHNIIPGLALRLSPSTSPFCRCQPLLRG